MLYSPMFEISKIASIYDGLEENIDNLDLIIDFTYSEIQHEVLMHLAKDYEILLLITDSGVGSDWVFFLEPSARCEYSAIKEFFAYFNYSSPSIIHNQIQKSLEIIELFHLENHLSTGNIIDAKKIARMLATIIKTKGIQSLAILGDDKASYMEKEGNLILYTEECIYQVNETGSILLVPRGAETSTNILEYFSSMIKGYLGIIENGIFNKYYVKKIWQEYSQKCTFFIVIVQNGERHIVGTYDNSEVNIHGEIIFYGGKNTTTLLKKPIITISANTVFTNPPGYPNLYQNWKFQEGTYFAVQKINKDNNYFKNYELFLYDKLDCGTSVFIYNYTKECYRRHLPYLGYAHIPSLYSITTGAMNVLKELGSNLPFVGGAGSSLLLSSKELFPTFTRVVTPIHYFAEAWTKLIGIYGWKNIVVFYTNETFGTALYNVFIKNENLYGYKILNDEKYRPVDNFLTNESIPNYYENMKNALSLGCNLFFLAMSDPTPFFWIEGLYDLGVRRGNITIILFNLASLDAIDSPGGNATKRRELLHGSFLIYNAAWVGEYGDYMRLE
ncbi:hypothetical protein SteCoe_37243 [Stentor coeruleus]|uniref:Receptor ligand binding region domain-containing protein n=1 Tax=Stentor coeruleus TaxID=5963 RepID=A0A1R2ANG3_9CILI|nr:hypothetical protein SteCoe_37243 [Stentor coeruleus]